MGDMDENVEPREPREGRVVGRVPADTFGHRLLLIRAHSGNLTIEEAAKRCGLLSQSWGNWERGRRPRDLLDVVEAISEGLDIDRSWLLDGGPLTRPDRKHRVRFTYFVGPSRPEPRRRPRRIDHLPRRAAA